MNQVFSFKRYWWLVKRQWYENAAIYTWGIVLMVLATGFLFWFTSSWKTIDMLLEANPNLSRSNFIGYPNLGQLPTFAIAGLVFIYIYGANFFESLTSINKKMFYFSLPVLPLERVAVAFTYVMILLPVLFVIVFTFFDLIAVQLFNHIHGTSVQMFFKTDSPFGSIGLMYVMIMSYLAYTSMFTLGSLMFGKKGVAISLFIIFGLTFVYSWSWRLLIHDGTVSFDVFLKSNAFIFNIFFIFLLSWTMMFFVMKKKEVS